MDNSFLEGRQLAGPSGGLSDLESPIHGNQQIMFGHAQGSALSHQCQIGAMDGKGSLQRGSSMNFIKGKEDSLCCATGTADMSEDDGPSFEEEGKGAKGSPWHRMKWTDNMIRLLIAVVARVSDDGTLEGVGSLKRKCRMLQKKGKWKTVSKIMIGMGCHVSAQQCEDKFNDLNKRYKKLNDILGRGTSCKVVENPALMDSMPKLSEKAKDVVRKTLNSKHLFYQEMCAYNNGQIIPNCPDVDLQGFSLRLDRSLKEDNGSEDDEVEQSDSSDDDNGDEETNESYDGDEAGKYYPSKKLKETDACHLPRAGRFSSIEAELAEVFENRNVSLEEKKEWIEKQKIGLLNEMISIKAQAFEIEKQRFKWVRYRSKKDEEFERLRLENERMRLQGEQSILHLRQKKPEMSLRSSENSSKPTSHGVEAAYVGDHIRLGWHQ